MAFIASVTKQCSYCAVLIEKGTATGFTWDRSNGGYIHTHCIPMRKQSPKTKIETAVAIADIDTDIRNGRNGDSATVDGDKAAALIRALQSLVVSPGIDEKEVRRIAADEASKVTTNRAIEIKIGEMPSKKFDLAHKDLPSLLRLVTGKGVSGHRMNVYMHGPAGSGKSTAARQTAEALDLPYAYMPLNPQTPDSRLLGYMHAGGEYVASEFFKRYTLGGVFCLDEIDNASASLVTTLNSLLDNGHGAFPHGIFPRHDDFVCVCTANTVGRGGDIQYPERRALDGAFLERFVFLLWEYDRDLTSAVVIGILGDGAAEFISWVDKTAEDLQARYPTLIVSPRAYIQGATLEKLNIPRREIVPMAIARGLK